MWRVVSVSYTHLDLENVAFSYTKDRELIKNLNLHVKPGQRIAIVGPTGCGKSTLINLLMRFYDVDEGCISVDGTPIQDLTLSLIHISRSFTNSTREEAIRWGRWLTQAVIKSCWR